MSSTKSPEKSPASGMSKQTDGPTIEPVTANPPHGKFAFNPKTWSLVTWVVVGITTTIIVVAAIVGGVLGARVNAYPDYFRIDYVLKDTYEGDSFFDKFDYFADEDPTHGFVQYTNLTVATTFNLTSITHQTPFPNTLSPTSGTAILRVDNTSENATTSGRRSVRISSKAQYTTGLFIFDIHHSPYGCSLWPALWLLGSEADWPTNGEIDVVEAVNAGDEGNQVTLHTTAGCRIGKRRRRKQTGRALTYDCWNATAGNVGCGVEGPQHSFGAAFNEKGGGVYAVELRLEGIRIWMFGRSDIPADIYSKTPDPASWPTPLADFPNTECDVGDYFKDMQIVVNIALCGDWAGNPNVFGQGGKCGGEGSGSNSSSCEDFVKSASPEMFDEAYWEFGGFWVYQSSGL